MKNTQPIIAILSFFLSFSLFAQTKTNFEIAEDLVELSISNLVTELNADKNYSLNFKSAIDYSILEKEVLKTFENIGIKIVPDSISDNKINYFLEEIKINYSEIFRDGIFGNYLVEREGLIKSSLFTSSSTEVGKIKSYRKVTQDSVFYSDIRKLENIAYTFTTAELPEEPFFASSLEPAIAIGTAAVAAYLLFNIRSK